MTPNVAKIRTIALKKNESVPRDASCTAEFLLGAASRYVKRKLLDPVGYLAESSVCRRVTAFSAVISLLCNDF
ncbi:hypothetical protein [Burkholderia ubonensis]|uniref:hypothetical protein n=1 Tax=Burkholderia ubonensis TaxID=101571 RepID=UPI0018E055C9|nr:hypothetical protein [Burkholderia ubonensis]